MITLTTEQAQQIEEALELFMNNVDSPPDKNCTCHISPPCSDCFNYSGLREALTVGPQALAAIREQKAELEKQEPVAVVDANDDGYWADILPDRSVKVGQKLYAAPVRTKDLSDGELEDAFKELGGKWNGDMWTIEDADLHPCLRKLICNGCGRQK